MIKYFVYPDRTRSKNDGDIHFISGEQLIRLYGVNPAECKIIRSADDERGYDTANITRLRPRIDGDYSLPDNNKRIGGIHLTGVNKVDILEHKS